MSHMCYDCRMSEVASRELRNHTRALLDRVAAGETVTITVDGRAAAQLCPVSQKQQWMPTSQFVSMILMHPADAALAIELDSMAPDTTDDLPWR